MMSTLAWMQHPFVLPALSRLRPTESNLASTFSHIYYQSSLSPIPVCMHGVCVCTTYNFPYFFLASLFNFTVLDKKKIGVEKKEG